MSLFYEFYQVNSEGITYRDANLDEVVFIEADTQAQAIEKALSIGIYFDGVEKGLDCRHCGDRWSMPEEILNFNVRLNQGLNYHSAIVHYADGRKERHKKNTQDSHKSAEPVKIELSLFLQNDAIVLPSNTFKVGEAIRIIAKGKFE